MLKPLLSAVGKTVLVSTLLSLIVCAFLPADVRLIAVVAIFSGCALALIPILRQVVNAPQTEAAQRKAAADALFDPIHPDRMWFHVGWDDQMMFDEKKNRPNSLGQATKAAYDMGFAARRDWSMGRPRS